MKKIFAIVMALAMVMALSVTAFAIEGSDEFKLTVGESETWGNHLSDAVTVNAPGEYTFTITGLSFSGANMTVLYLKDAEGADADASGGSYSGPSSLTGATVYTKSIKINGEEVSLAEGYPTGTTDEGIYDICWFNIWGSSYFEAYNGTVNEIEVVVEFVGEGEAAPVDEAAAPVEDGTAADNNTVEPEAAPEAAPEASAPAASTETKAPATGIAIAVIPAVMALAAVAVSKKR